MYKTKATKAKNINLRSYNKFKHKRFNYIKNFLSSVKINENFRRTCSNAVVILNTTSQTMQDTLYHTKIRSIWIKLSIF